MNVYEVYDRMIDCFSYEHLLNELWCYFGSEKIEEAFRSIANTWDIPLDDEEPKE